ncbi:hypothetical protein [Azospirillum soli]|uniref:hypothetical protein n=1 Tax=Azospirillum soli TaxID=1304799 RepID=UPI001AE3005E|nr:hypothetical protein [Azospirillum soli]MBP2316316.1 hypothetical protein [Azospirillum soli]
MVKNAGRIGLCIMILSAALLLPAKMYIFDRSTLPIFSKLSAAYDHSTIMKFLPSGIFLSSVKGNVPHWETARIVTSAAYAYFDVAVAYGVVSSILLAASIICLGWGINIGRTLRNMWGQMAFFVVMLCFGGIMLYFLRSEIFEINIMIDFVSKNGVSKISLDDFLSKFYSACKSVYAMCFAFIVFIYVIACFRRAGRLPLTAMS